jgi:hypothetical protein
MSSQMVLSLPDWPTIVSSTYLDSCIELFANELENAQEERSSSIITVYAYLRGHALLARGHLLDGLRDLYLIEHPQLFPRDYIETTIVPLLADAFLLDLFLNEPFYTESAEWKKINTRPVSSHMSIIDLERSGNTLDETVPIQSSTQTMIDSEWTSGEHILTFEQFSAYVHQLNIVLDKETTEKLFHALLYWTDDSLANISKKDKTSSNSHSSKDDSNKSSKIPRRTSISSNKLEQTLTLLNDHQRGNQNTMTSSKIISQPSKTSVPTILFEYFLDIWQQTNAEKVRMNRCLPEDRKKKESILKVRSIYCRIDDTVV